MVQVDEQEVGNCSLLLKMIMDQCPTQIGLRVEGPWTFDQQAMIGRPFS